MENHIYKFGGELRRQQDGGPIGLELTGALADLFMLYWDRKFLNKLEELFINVKGYKRFKDDTDIMLEPVDRKMKFEEGHLALKTKEEIEKEIGLEDDEISMKVVKDVADSIEEMIETEVDFPTNKKNIDKKMAILDIKVWVKKMETENGDGINQVFYEFYEKPMSSKFVLMKDSAAPLNQKRTVLTQEGIRRLKNCKMELEWDQKAKHLENFMQKLKNSGYDERFRLEILKSSINGYEKIVEDHQNGVKPMYRSREWKEKNKWNAKKSSKKENWWKGKEVIKNKSVIFVPATPGRELAKIFKEIEKEQRNQNENMMNFQIIEQTGVSLERMFQKSNPFKETDCGKQDCVVCDGKGVKCRDEGVGYRGVCKECSKSNMRSEYLGETGKNAYTRGKQHMGGLRKKNEENAFYKHWRNFHETPLEADSRRLENFEIRVEKSFKDPMTRQINEMVRIKKFQGTLLNSKSEWNAPPIVRIIAQNESERNPRKLKQNASNKINSVQPTPLNNLV